MKFDPLILSKGSSPHKHVPRDHDRNMEFRDDLKKWIAMGELGYEERLLDWCKKDVLFFANAMCWTLDSKRFPGAPLRPWISFKDFQDDLFLELEEAWGPPDKSGQVGHDLVWVKSRDCGASHIPAFAALRRYLFFPGQVIYFVSEKAELVDDPGDPGSIFPKMDIVIGKLSKFMTKDVCRKTCMFYYMGANKKPDPIRGLLKGLGTTDIAVAGTRPTAVVADEFGIWESHKSLGFLASSEGATNSRLFMGTPKGQGNGFHKVATESEIPRTNIHWTQHPWHRQGLYQSNGEGGEIRFLDNEFWGSQRLDWLKKNHPLLARKINLPGMTMLRGCYNFQRDGRVRSPYYDTACARSPFPWQIAQEHDLDFHGSGTPFYDAALLQSVIDRHSVVPLYRGTLAALPFTFEVDEWNETPNGDCMLWCELTKFKGQTVPIARRHRCYMGVDVSAGTGATWSAISVWDCVLREKVFRWARRDRRPDRLAETAFCIGSWFDRCSIIFEGTGHGATFGNRLLELGYPRVFRMLDKKSVRHAKTRSSPGLFLDHTLKLDMCSNYGRGLFDGEATNHDRDALKEGFNFHLKANALIEHTDQGNRANPGGAAKNHGDLWMADVLAWREVRRIARGIDADAGAPENFADEETQNRLAEIEELKYARARW